MIDLAALTKQLVEIPSPTKDEKAVCDFIENWIKEEVPGVPYSRTRNSLIVCPPQEAGKPVIGLFGHIDTVPADPDQPLGFKDGRLYGCGSSDMKSGDAVMMALLKDYEKLNANLVAVFYDGEEGPDEGNGMKDLMPSLPHIDFAIVLEPTNNAIMAGCMGGMHAIVTFEGERAHSARPWQGKNAIFRSLPVLTKLRDLPRRETVVSGLTFYEVMSPTMASTRNAANIIPDNFEINVNIRFAPNRTDAEALDELKRLVGDLASIRVRDISVPGKVCVSHPLMQEWIDKCSLKVEPKQAWTDLARLTANGIPAVNFGPGDPDRCHQAVEWMELANLEECYKLLTVLLTDICAKVTNIAPEI